VGTPHPGPGKGASFQHIDLGSVREMVPAATAAGVRHVVYVSVAHPAPIMHAYIAARASAESLLRDAALPTTVLRPWYVLGPGHRWPYLLLPLYWLWERREATRDRARRLGLVTLAQMVAALVHAVEHPVLAGTRILDVPAIRAASAVRHVSPSRRASA
jgi:nucleoside-diphosphate-sugar epimerase